MWYAGGMDKTASDLHLIMMAVQKLVDEMLPPDEDDGQYDYTPAILDRMQGVQDTVCKTLGLPNRPLIAPDD